METQFYSLDTKVSYGRSSIQIEPLVDYIKYTLFTEGTTLIENNRFKVVKGKKWYDFIPFADSFNFAISERIKIAFEENNLTGWSCFPIIIDDYPDEKYFVFQVLTFAGELLNKEALSNYETSKHEFDINTWNGDDIFTLSGTINIVCNKKTKDILVKLTATNFEIDEF